MEKYVAYYRVSTEDQGKSGLGLASQKEHVENYCSRDGVLITAFTDVESGTSDNREGLNKAIETCELTGATLVVKNLSRLSRGGFKIMVELDSKNITYIESDAPNDPQMLKEFKMSMAKNEAKQISDRTKAALDQIKSNIKTNGFHISKNGNKITSLGNPQNLGSKGVQKSIEVRMAKARNNPNNKKAYAFIKALLETGGLTQGKITKLLNEAGFRTSKGCEFSPTQVSRLVKMYKQ